MPKVAKDNTEILCRGCAAYSECKLTKKGTAVQCRNYWTHRPTSDFTKAIDLKEVSKEDIENNRSSAYDYAL